MLGPVAAWITALTRGTMAGWNQVLSQPVWQLVPLMSSSDSGRCRRHCHPERWDGWHHWMTHITLYFYRFHFGSPFVSSSLVTSRSHQLCLPGAGSRFVSPRARRGSEWKDIVSFPRRLWERRENLTDKDCSVTWGALERFSFLFSDGAHSHSDGWR